VRDAIDVRDVKTVCRCGDDCDVRDVMCVSHNKISLEKFPQEEVVVEQTRVQGGLLTPISCLRVFSQQEFLVSGG
jgi:hypothetical protein